MVRDSWAVMKRRMKEQDRIARVEEKLRRKRAKQDERLRLQRERTRRRLG
jgi:hypothetical protein